ncbi:hypothetical protein [Microbacterium schleiferi]|uniref:Uncharacterized protein n=1 Tax=Microbacterium schleiferi TaxID=69362 RepID=A0ABU7V5W1_9MICO
MAGEISIDLSPVFRQLQQLENQVTHTIQVEVGGLRSDLVRTDQKLEILRAAFEDYVNEARRTAIVQRAETKLSGLKDDLEREYGHYQAVRRTSIGILQAFDVGNVSNHTVTQVSEELMIQTPRYWLAPALVALAAWSKDNEEIAKISVEEAFRRDPRKTSMFFALVLRRQGREELAVRWLKHYLRGQDPRGLGRHFAVIFESLAQGAFGPAGAQFAGDQLVSWMEQLRQDPELVDKQVQDWRSYAEVSGLFLHDDEYPNLRSFCPEWPLLKELIEASSSLPVLIDHFRKIHEGVFAAQGGTIDQLDELLEQLVTNYDEEELPLRRDIAMQEAIIEQDGDLDRARVQAEVMDEALATTIDALSLQTFVAMEPELLAVSPRTQQLAVGATRGEIESGISQFVANYRSKVPTWVRVVLGADHTPWASTYGFPGWETRSDVSDADSVSSLRRHWEDTFEKYIDARRVKPAKYVLAGAAGLFLFIVMLLLNLWVLALILLVLVGGLAGGLWMIAKKRAEKDIAELERNRERAIADSVELYRLTMKEFYDASQDYAEFDQRETELIGLLRMWQIGVASNANEAGAEK